MSVKLTPKQQKFCYKYIETGNASEAYRRSYNAENMKSETVNREAKKLIDNPKITTRISRVFRHVNAAGISQLMKQGICQSVKGQHK